MRTEVDLSQLRGGAPAATVPNAQDMERERLERANNRRLAIQTWGPLVIAVAVAAGLTLWFLVPLLQPVVTVTTAPIVVRVDTQAAARVTAVQASGWVEPDPYPIEIAPLVDGIVKTLPVVEGTPLVAGETVIVQLDTTLIDAQIVRARTNHDSAIAEALEARTQVASALERLEQNIEARLKTTRLAHELEELKQRYAMAVARQSAAEVALRLNTPNRLRVAAEEQTLAKLEGEHAVQQAELTALAKQLEWLQQDAEAAREMANDNAASKLRAVQAEADANSAEARLAGKRAMVSQLANQIRATKDALDAARKASAEPSDLQRELDEAKAEVVGLKTTIALHEHHNVVAREAVENPVDLRTLYNNAKARLALREKQVLAAKATLDDLLVRLALHKVVSPVDGEVLAVIARPGGRVGPGTSNPVVITAFRPGELQVRVDLPFSDMPTVRQHQEVQVISDSAPGRHFDAEVSRLVRQADIARNTLEVKVRIFNPDDSLRPEMLVRCRFLPMKPEESPTETNEPKVERYFVPSSAVSSAEGGSAIYIYDPRGRLNDEGTARRIEVEVVPTTGTEPPGHVEVKGALSRSFLVIEHPATLTDGTRVALPPTVAAPESQPEEEANP